MKNLRPLLVATLFGALTTASSLPAAQPSSPNPAVAVKNAQAKPYPLPTCLVTDEKFEGSDMKPYEMVHEGQTIKFCCKSCVKDFNKDPKKYVTKLAAEVKKQNAAKNGTK